MHAPRDPAVSLLPRTVTRSTALAGRTVIIHPAGDDPGYAALAQKIAAALAARGAATPECVTDLALMPERSTPLPAAYRARPLIVLGNLNTNRTLQPLYANYLCSTDATYPGGDGYDLRTLVNPYGTGANLILAGGSTLRGVERAVDKLIQALQAAGPAHELPFLFAVELAPALAAELATWPYTPLDDSAELQALRSRGLMFYTEPIRVIGAYTLMWSWTADARYAHSAVDALRRLNATMHSGYGDWHYLAERFMRAIPLLIAGGFMTAEDIRRTDELLLLTAWGNETEWWRMTTGEPPFGHRHQGKGTYEFLLLARYLRDQCNPPPELRTVCDRWIAECHAFLDALAAARICDQDDESSLNNIATIYRYALGEERHAFFTSGNARLVAERCLALHDNNGNGAGQGGYGESQGMYLQQEATLQTAASAFYYGDGRLKWVLHQLPNLAVSQRYYFLHYAPVFLQKFDTGPELQPVPPPAEHNLACLPVTDHQLRISNHPPVHIEPQGHMINAPETWELPEAVGLNRLPQERGFDKIALRGGYTREDAYLLIQGYQGGFRWQGHMQAANCLVRFYQAGHVWLVQNTSRHSLHDKNGLLISDGANNTPLQPIAERVALADFPTTALTVTRLTNYHHTDWTRHLFWSKAGEGCFVIIDHVAFKADGPYSLTCSWRTPGYATLDGRRWHTDQGLHRFTLVAGAEVAATCEVDTDQGACSPYVLRQRRAGAHAAGSEASFQNLFYVRTQDSAETLDLQRLDERSALVLRNRAPQAWCAAAVQVDTVWLPGAGTNAASVWANAGSLTFAGLTTLNLESIGWRTRSDVPISLQLNLAANSLTLQLDAPGAGAATVMLGLDGAAREIKLSTPVTLPLPAAGCSALAGTLAAWLATLRPALTSATTRPAPADRGWKSAWTFDCGTRVPEVLRSVRVTAAPLPVNGSPDELLDPVMPDGYSRETWIQWPVAPHYQLTLTLPEPRPLTALHLLGDCPDDPTLRTFNPLPDGITVTAEKADGSTAACPMNPGPDRPYKRYRDAENRLHTRTASFDGAIKALHVHIPAPPAGRPFVLHRLEVCSDQTRAPAIERWITADLDGDKSAEIILSNAKHELIVLGADGRERWRTAFSTNITHISAQPLDPSGPPVLCVGLLGGDFLLFHPDGSRRAVWQVARHMQARPDCLQGWYNSAHCAAIWKRDAQGRGWLVLGGYAILVFLNADGEIVGHSFADGPWIFDLLVSPATRPDPSDIYARCGWNHGVLYYPHVPGDGPSGEVYHLGGFNQPMFRMLKRVIPFLNGRSLAFEWADLDAYPDGAIFAATELGCGVLSSAHKDWAWKLEGGMSLNACATGRLDDESVALTGGADGFVTAISLTDGRVLRSYHAGAPVLGVAPARSGEWFVATRAGVQTLDADWQPVSSFARPLNRVLPLDRTRLLISREDHTLELLELVT
ncbi:MAG: hypothetical protein KBF26_04715 [Opitutaceae bacterium]|nr:hypothetical protein [Opitutaceae bacterium]